MHLYHVGHPRHAADAAVLRNQLRTSVSTSSSICLPTAAWNDRWEAGDFDWLTQGSVVDADPDDDDLNFFYSDGPWNTHVLQRPEVEDSSNLRALPGTWKRVRPSSRTSWDPAGARRPSPSSITPVDITGLLSTSRATCSPGDALPGEGLAGQVRRQVGETARNVANPWSFRTQMTRTKESLEPWNRRAQGQAGGRCSH